MEKTGAVVNGDPPLSDTSTSADEQSADIEIVVSRFKEDITPLLELLCDPSSFTNQAFIVTVYNKGGDNLHDELANACSKKERQIAHGTVDKSSVNRFKNLIQNTKKFSVESLENLGREADTYLYHLIHKYDRLAKVTVFLPASCMNEVKIEHTRQLITRVSRTNNSVLAGQWITPSVRGRLGKFLIKKWQGNDATNASHLPTAAVQPSTRRPYSAWYDHFFPNIQVNVVCYYSMFAASASHIKARPVSFYQDLYQEVHVHPNPETGHYLERSWAAIFHPLPDECIYAAKPNRNDSDRNASANTRNSTSNKDTKSTNQLRNTSMSQLLGLYQSKGVKRPREKES